MTQPSFNDSNNAAVPEPAGGEGGRSPRVFIVAGAVAGLIVAGVLAYVIDPPPAKSHQTITVPDVNRSGAATPKPADALELIAPFTGSWQGRDESIRIDTRNSVVEILRQNSRDDDSYRLDHYAAAPVRIQSAQRLLELETSEGIWRLALLPGESRGRLRIIFPDGREAQYDPQ